jgi:hypothetical protein
MNESIISRLTMPAIISLMGLAITQAWYVKTSETRIVRGQSGSAIAILTTKNDIIERRPTTRIIWERLGQGEQLFGGEAVRTGPSASGRITFLKSGMSIGIEPDSLVIMEESNGKLQLNLVNGGVFVKSEAAAETAAGKRGSEQPILKAGDKKIELSSKSSEVNLSVSESGMANVSVAKGNAQIAGASGKTETLTQGTSKALSTSAGTPSILEFLGPRSGASIPISGSNDSISIGWSNAPENATVFIESGTTRDGLVRLQQSVTAKTGKINLPVRPRDFFWRLVAVKDGKILAASPTIFNKGVTLDPPLLLTFSTNEKLTLSNAELSPTVRLSWTRPAGSEDITVQLAKDPEFKDTIATKTLNTESEWKVPIKEAGRYFWRASARWPGIARSVQSKTGTFEAMKQREIPAPVASSPAPGTIIPKSESDQNGIILSWSGPEGIEGYQVQLSRRQADNSLKSVLTKSVTGRQFRVTNVPTGEYFWTVRSRIGDSQSEASPQTSFSVSEVAPILFKNPATKDKPLAFLSADTIISIPLNALPSDTTQVRFKFANAVDGLVEASWQPSIPGKPLQVKLPTAGIYYFRVEALNKDRQLIGLGDKLELISRAADLLPPPQLLTKTQVLTSDETGGLDLKWNRVAGAVRYLVQISGPKTKFRKEISTTQLSVSNLEPGRHSLVLAAIDEAGRLGVRSPEIAIDVPDVSSIAAPTTKGIKVR